MKNILSNNYSIVDMDTWERKEHFHFFRRGKHSNYGLTAIQDITPLILLREEQKDKGCRIRLSTMLYYLVMKAVHQIDELRLRMVDDRPVLYEEVHPSFTYIPAGKSLHANCLSAYKDTFSPFSENVERARVLADEIPSLSPAGGSGQNLIYLTVVNGVHFTAISNPWGDTLVDSVPRISFGKVENSDGRYTLPISIEVLHEFVDGSHISQFYQYLSEYIERGESLFL